MAMPLLPDIQHVARREIAEWPRFLPVGVFPGGKSQDRLWANSRQRPGVDTGCVPLLQNTYPGKEAVLKTLLRASGKQFPFLSPRALIAVARQAARHRQGLAARADLAGIAALVVRVIAQGAGVREGLAAGRSGVGAVAGMGAHVASQAAGF